MFPYQLQKILINFRKYCIFSVSNEVIPDQSGIYTVIDISCIFDIRIRNKGHSDLFGDHFLHGVVAVYIAAVHRQKEREVDIKKNPAFRIMEKELISDLNE